MRFKGNFGELELSIEGNVANGKYQENGTLSGEYTDNVFKGVWHNKGLSGLIEFSIIDGKLDGRWKKGIEPGPMKSKWEGNLIEEEIELEVNIKELEYVKKNNATEKKVSSDPGYLSQLFQNEDYSFLCSCVDTSIYYSPNTIEKILVSAIKTNNEEIEKYCYDYYKLKGDKFLKDSDRKKWGNVRMIIRENKIEDKYKIKYLTLKYNSNTFYIKDYVEEKTEDYEYIGEKVNGVRTGKGKFTWADGDSYEGDFIEDVRTGKGKYTWVNGNSYEGDFINNERTGIGKYIWADGDYYEGDFIKGKITGKGKFIWVSGNIYEGDFIDNKKTSKGKFKWSNGDIYEGVFINDIRTGKGKYTWVNGNFYEGDFIQGKMTGKGKKQLKDGDIYEGSFINGLLNGEGKRTRKSGVVYDGTFKNDELNGYGKILLSTGTIHEKGLYVDGILEETNKTEKSTIKSNSKNIIESDKTKETDKKNEIRFFKVTYKIKLTQSKSKTELKGRELGMIGIILNGAKTEKIKTNDKGDLITREITIKYTGLKIPVGVMKDKIETHDIDVKSGRAGTSTIKIIDVKEVNYAIGAV